MNEQTQRQKLAILRGRCRNSAKVIQIIQVITIIGALASLIGALVCIIQRERIDQYFVKAVQEGSMTVEKFQVGGGLLDIVIDLSEVMKEGNYAIPLFFYCMLAMVICLGVTMILHLLKKIFTRLVQEDNPFADSILNDLKVVSIVLSIIVLLFVGLGPGVIAALFMWCIYSVFEYGKALQTEVDEML